RNGHKVWVGQRALAMFAAACAATFAAACAVASMAVCIVPAAPCCAAMKAFMLAFSFLPIFAPLLAPATTGCLRGMATVWGMGMAAVFRAAWIWMAAGPLGVELPRIAPLSAALRWICATETASRVGSAAWRCCAWAMSLGE